MTFCHVFKSVVIRINSRYRICFCTHSALYAITQPENAAFNKRKEVKMATNPPVGDGHRNGMVRNRSQVLNPKTGIWTKRGPDGRFMDGKQDGAPFKGVRKEH